MEHITHPCLGRVWVGGGGGREGGRQTVKSWNITHVNVTCKSAHTHAHTHVNIFVPKV